MAKKNIGRKTTRSVAATVERALQRRAEKKIGLVGAIAAAPTTTGVVLTITTNIAQGDNFDNRTGDKITIQGLHVKTRATALLASQSMRFILFVDRFNQGTLPGVTEVLQNNVFFAGYNQLTVWQQRRFLILKDWMFDCNIAGEAIKSLTFDHGGTGDVYYNGTTAVAASNGKGSIFLLIIGSAATGTYDYTVTTRYTDM